MNANTMKYRGYTASIQYDDEDQEFCGDVVDLRDTITFSGSSVAELRDAFHAAVDDYIEFCEQRGEAPEKPYSGRFVLRIEPSLHRRASVAAEVQQVSLNAFVEDAIQRAVHTPLVRLAPESRSTLALTGTPSFRSDAYSIERARVDSPQRVRAARRGERSLTTTALRWADSSDTPELVHGVTSVSA